MSLVNGGVINVNQERLVRTLRTLWSGGGDNAKRFPVGSSDWRHYWMTTSQQVFGIELLLQAHEGKVSALCRRLSDAATDLAFTKSESDVQNVFATYAAELESIGVTVSVDVPPAEPIDPHPGIDTASDRAGPMTHEYTAPHGEEPRA